jgi:hypothetical protein
MCEVCEVKLIAAVLKRPLLAAGACVGDAEDKVPER